MAHIPEDQIKCPICGGELEGYNIVTTTHLTTGRLRWDDLNEEFKVKQDNVTLEKKSDEVLISCKECSQTWDSGKGYGEFHNQIQTRMYTR